MTLVKKNPNKKELKAIRIRNGHHKNIRHLRKIYWPYLPIISVIGLFLAIIGQYNLFKNSINLGNSSVEASLANGNLKILILLIIALLILISIILVILKLKKR